MADHRVRSHTHSALRPLIFWSSVISRRYPIPVTIDCPRNREELNLSMHPYNLRQSFNFRGMMFLVGRHPDGGYGAFRIDLDGIDIYLASLPHETIEEAEVEAERLRKEALN